MTTLAKQLSDLVGNRVRVQSSIDVLSRGAIVAVLTRREGTKLNRHSAASQNGS